MRFLNTRTGTFVELVPEQTGYAILSHTWDEGGEQSYQELSSIQQRHDLEVLCPRHSLRSLRSSSPSS